jgi:hypothetical protein
MGANKPLNKPKPTKSEEIALAAAKQAIKEFASEEKAKRKKQIFQNANVLLEHYLDLKAYCDNAIYSNTTEQIEDDENDQDVMIDTDGEEITIKSIKANRELTLIFIAHIDMALMLLKHKCDVKEIPEKYKVIEKLHLNPKLQELSWGDRVAKVAEEIPCADRTVTRWRNEMVRDLSVFLFGVEGLKLIV